MHPRVALFACAYNEVDGVANTLRHFERYAAARDLPLLNIHGGDSRYDRSTGTIRRVEFPRRFPKFPVDKKHDFDLLFWRYFDEVKQIVREFRADVVHITGPSDVGMMGALVAHRLGIPLVASWHTNLHEYAEQRFSPLIRWLPADARRRAGDSIRNLSLRALARYYHIPKLLFAPNPELVELLERLTGKRCFVMSRGVDLELFTPLRRTRESGPFTLGYVGRLTVEKNVEMLVRLEQQMIRSGMTGFRFLIVGQGGSEPWLRAKLKSAEFTGVLQGKELAEAYANMDVFVFPSQTDTFGNVVLEALASGVPAIVTGAGGPKFIVRNNETGFVAFRESEFGQYVRELMTNPERQRSMARAARAFALGQSWDAVFDSVYDKYRELLAGAGAWQGVYPSLGTGVQTAGAAL